MVRTELVELEVMLAKAVTQHNNTHETTTVQLTRCVGRVIAANTVGTYYHCFCWIIEN